MRVTSALLRSYVYQFCEQKEVSTTFSNTSHMALKDWLKASLKRTSMCGVVKAPKSCHISPILRSLHWLKITERIEYKLLSFTNMQQIKLATRQLLRHVNIVHRIVS